MQSLNTLDQINAWLKGLQKGSTVTVSKSLFNKKKVPLIVSVFSMLGIDSLELSKIKIDTSGKNNSLSGTGTLFGDDNTALVLAFAERQKKLILDLSYTLSEDSSWNLIPNFSLSFGKLSGSLTADTELDVLLMDFDATITTGNDGGLNMPVQLQVPSYSGDWTLKGSLDQLGSLTDEAIKALAGGNDLLGALPTNVVDLKYLQLSNFEVAFDPEAATVSLVNLGLAYTKPGGWQLFSPKLLLTEIDFAFTVLNPVNSQPVSFQAQLSAQLQLAGATIEVGGQFPDKYIFARLQEDTPLSLTKLLQDFEVPMPQGFPEVEIDRLGFMLGLDAQTIDFSIAIMKPVPILGKVQLNNFSFEINSSQGDNASTTGALTTQFGIGESTLTLQGNYASSGAVTLSGEATNVPIGDLINTIDDQFGLSTPTFVKNIRLKKLTLLYASSGNFSFYCDATTALAGNDKLQIFVNILANSSGDQYQREANGAFVLNDQQLLLDIKSGTGANSLSASWQATGGSSLSIDDITGMFGLPDLPTEPDFLQPYLDLTALSFSYDFDKKELSFSASSAKGELFLISSLSAKAERISLIGIQLQLDVSLDELPLLGDKLPKAASFALQDLYMLVSLGSIDAKDVGALNGLISSVMPDFKGQLPTAGTTGSQFLLGGDALAGTDTLPFQITLGGGTASNAATLAQAAPAQAAPTTADMSWVAVQKSLGPITIAQLGYGYANDSLLLGISGNLQAAGLTLSLDGLEASIPLADISKLSFSLQGLGLDYQNAAVELGGELIRVPGSNGAADTYNGGAILQAENLGLSAFGSYTEIDDHPSLFAYAVLNAPLGGPPFLFVTGLAAGMGFNRSLSIPDIDQVASFPLVQEAVDQSASLSNFSQTADAMATWMPPELGGFFLAAGVRFSSFELVDSFVLLTVAFGQDLSINLLGLSTLKVPTPVSSDGSAAVDPIAEVQVALKAGYSPAEGVLRVQAQLTDNSFILSKKATLTGGLAFYAWLQGAQAGDFVFTLGGYHPDFDKVKPADYPEVPRLGINWPVDDHLSIKGDAYFALTAQAVMAGGSLQATWQSGKLKAWFSESADFIIAWKPYYYEASTQIEVGVSYTYKAFGTHKLDVDVSAGLDVKGPDFSGSVHIDIKITSFTIRFGDNQSSPKPISWDAFVQSFLSTDQSGALTTQSLAASGGLSAGQVNSQSADTLLADPTSISFDTDSRIPLTSITVAGGPSFTATNTDFGVAPVGIKSGQISSELRLSLTTKDGKTNMASQFDFAIITKNLPRGLWGTSLQPDISSGDQFIMGGLTGLSISIKPPADSDETHSIRRDLLDYDLTQETDYYDWKPVPALVQDPGITNPKASIKEALNDAKASKARAKLLKELGMDPKAVSTKGNLVGSLYNTPVINTAS